MMFKEKNLILIAVVFISVGFWFSGFKVNQTVTQEDVNSEQELLTTPDVEATSGVAEPDSTSSPQATLGSTKTPVLIDDNQFISFLHLAREQFKGGQLAESKDSYQKAIANGSNAKLLVANAWFELYYVLVALNDIESARAALDTAIEMDPGNDTFLNAKTQFEQRES